jgi:2-methylcitrate dehydratase PrpD
VDSPFDHLARRYASWGDPGESVEARTYDALAALVTGRVTSEGAAIRTLVAEPWHTGILGDVAGRVAAARLTELDDIHLPSGTTPGAVVVPTAVTIGAALDVDPASYGRAVEIGYDAMARLGGSIGGSIAVYRGVWPTYFCAPFASAAVSAALFGLTPEQTANALCIALTRATGLTSGVVGQPLGRWWTLGDAARAGCSAALAARHGFVAEIDLTRLAQGAGIDLDAAALHDEIDPATDAVSIKPFPIAKQSLAATQAALTLSARVPHDRITRVRVHVPPAYAQMIARPPRASSRLSRVSSAKWNVALALARSDLLDDVDRSTPVDDSEIVRLSSLVEVVADPELAHYFPARWPARVCIDDAEETVIDAVGDPPANGTAAVQAKWERRGQRMDWLRNPSPCALDEALRADSRRDDLAES